MCQVWLVTNKLTKQIIWLSGCYLPSCHFIIISMESYFWVFKRPIRSALTLIEWCCILTCFYRLTLNPCNVILGGPMGATSIQMDQDDYLTPSIKSDYHDLTKERRK